MNGCEECLADTQRRPAWTAYLREAHARDIAIMERFLEARRQPDGQPGGGYGDDVKLLRSRAANHRLEQAAVMPPGVFGKRVAKT